MEETIKYIPRIMIATGDDKFAMELARVKYLENIKASRGEAVSETFDSSAERLEEFLARAMTASFFQEVRFYSILHVNEFRSERDLKALDQALDYNIPDVYIFISIDTDKKKNTGAKAAKILQIKKRGNDESTSVQDFTRPPDYQIPKWLVAQMPSLFNRRISMQDAEYLAKAVDYDMLYPELQKIDMALAPGAPVDMAIIKEIVGETREMTVYELASALGGKDLPSALKVLDSLFTGTFDATGALSATFRHFWAMLRIKKFIDANPEILRKFNTRGYGASSPQSMAAFEIGVAAGLLTEKTKNRVFPVMINSGIVKQAQGYSEKGLLEILKTLQRFDVDMKTGKVEPIPYNLQMLCYRIVRAA